MSDLRKQPAFLLLGHAKAGVRSGAGYIHSGAQAGNNTTPNRNFESPLGRSQYRRDDGLPVVREKVVTEPRWRSASIQVERR
ncbi:hypothetical protein E2C01_044781 [Portunus trituberculatus]|uniref:Uncharacterized protein n=1 Tax=Portunus trituberculatus TaxID=210409 RepID=A0A5B7G038_PORTR|nr:hypothetical protein [Portunus trituberculatus]